jgi:hypothetical protein
MMNKEKALEILQKMIEFRRDQTKLAADVFAFSVAQGHAETAEAIFMAKQALWSNPRYK